MVFAMFFSFIVKCFTAFCTFVMYALMFKWYFIYYLEYISIKTKLYWYCTMDIICKLFVLKKQFIFIFLIFGLRPNRFNIYSCI